MGGNSTEKPKPTVAGFATIYEPCFLRCALKPKQRRIVAGPRPAPADAHRALKNKAVADVHNTHVHAFPHR